MADKSAPERDAWIWDIGRWAVVMALLFAGIAVPAPLWQSAEVSATGLATVGFGAVLVALSAIDIKTQRLPDMLTYPLACAGLLEGWALAPPDLPIRLVGLCLGFLMLAVIAEGYRRSRGVDGLGLGDAKLLGAGGAWIGALGLPSALLLGSGLALTLALLAKALGRDVRPETRIPFGPFIAIGLWIVWLYGPIV